MLFIMQVLSWYPRIVLFPAFADNATVAQIIALAKPLLQPSELGTAALTDEQKANQPVRVLHSLFFFCLQNGAGVGLV
jgi:hypothetical protein